MPGARQALWDPDQLMRSMETPEMQELLNNPEAMKAQLKMSPEISAMLEKFPHLAEAIENPENIRKGLHLMKGQAKFSNQQRNREKPNGQDSAHAGSSKGFGSTKPTMAELKAYIKMFGPELRKLLGVSFISMGLL